jgi:hypothetical protein
MRLLDPRGARRSSHGAISAPGMRTRVVPGGLTMGRNKGSALRSKILRGWARRSDALPCSFGTARRATSRPPCLACASGTRPDRLLYRDDVSGDGIEDGHGSLRSGTTSTSRAGSGWRCGDRILTGMCSRTRKRTGAVRPCLPAWEQRRSGCDAGAGMGAAGGLRAGRRPAWPRREKPAASRPSSWYASGSP